MPTYELLSGTQYRVRARNEDEAHEKLAAYWHGNPCPCGLPQWGFHEARQIEERGELAGDHLCECVEEGEVDTLLQFVDGHPEA